MNLDPHEWISNGTVALIAKHLPQEAANLLFLTNGALIVVLDYEFDRDELNKLPEYIRGREIHYTSKVGIRPSVGSGAQVGGVGRREDQSAYCPWKGNLLERTTVRSKGPIFKSRVLTSKPSAVGVVVQLPNGDRLLSVATYGYVIPNSIFRQEQGAFRRLFGGSREGQLILAIAMSPVGASQAEISSPVCLDN